MKTFVFLLGLLLSNLTIIAQDSTGVTLTVTVENVLNENGQILAGLHTSETFMKGRGVANFKGKAAKGEVTFTFNNVAPGAYAISVMHDENNNMQMDREANGMPKESYGISGNDMTMGPPSFEDAKFEVTDKDLELRIRF